VTQHPAALAPDHGERDGRRWPAALLVRSLTFIREGAPPKPPDTGPAATAEKGASRGSGGTGGEPARSDTGSASALIGQVVGNASFLTAALFYMGWAYENSQSEYFHVSALSLDISLQQYVLKSLNVFFTPDIMFSGAALVVVIAAGPWLYQRFCFVLQNRRAVGVAVAMLIALLCITWAVLPSRLLYLLLGLLGAGLLLLTWPGADGHRFPFALAIVSVAAFILWVAGDYARDLGQAQAANFYGSDQTAVALYSTQSLALTGPGVSCAPLRGNSLYHYRCEGLYLLYNVPGTAYYLLPSRQASNIHTYVIGYSDQIRVEFYAPSAHHRRTR
jgi:hypothetical protein